MFDIVISILIIALYLSFVAGTIFVWKETIEYRSIFPLIISIIMTIIVIIPIAWIFDDYKEAKATTETEIVQVEVLSKNYSPARTTYIFVNKIMMPMHISEKYSVTISDGEFEKTYDDKELYSNLNVGDKFMMNKISYKNRKGKVFKQDYEFITESKKLEGQQLFRYA